MTDGPDEPFVIIGAGLAGGLLAALLGKAGHEVLVLERRADPRRGSVDGGRSINLAISARGLAALDRIGLRADVLARAIPLRGRMIHPLHGALAFQPYGAHGEAINSISRAALNALLLDAAERSGKVEIRFGRRCLDVDPATGVVTTVASEGAEARTTHRGIVLGADGAYSAVRQALERFGRCSATQSVLGHGYKELAIPAGPEGAHRLEPHALHIWPRGGLMMMAMANLDGSFTVTLYLPMEGRDGFGSLTSPDRVDAFFAANFPDAVELIPSLAGDFARNPTGSLVTVHARPWHVDGRVALVGDAAHAIVPFFGQGANAGFEGCVALAEALAASPGDPARAFRRYEADRLPNTEAIAELALGNFHEMRDHVASPLFRFEKRAEVALHRLVPRWYVPLYTMISFTQIPYAEAARRARRQQRALRLAGVLLLLALALVLVTLVR